MSGRLRPRLALQIPILAALLSALVSACSAPVHKAPPLVPPPAAPAAEKPETAPEIKAVIPLPDLPPQARFWEPLLKRLNAEGFDGAELAELFSRPGMQFDPRPMRFKLRELYRLLYGADLTRQVQVGLIRLGYTPGPADGMAGEHTRLAIQAFQRVHGLPADGQPSPNLLGRIEADLALPEDRRPKPVITLVEDVFRRLVYRGYLTPQRLGEAKAFLLDHRPWLQEMERRYGVPAEVAVGILRVETNLGQYLGDESALVILASMALCSEFERIEPYVTDLALDQDRKEWLKGQALDRGEWAYQELKALLEYARMNRRNPLDLPGSIYGAIGISQFMPTNALLYGADGDGDGRVDLFSLPDAIFSIGRYLREHGWQGDMSAYEKKKEVLYRYNRSTPYVNTVLAVADYLASFKAE
ncbi:MAG: lytic murein transglycosylase [Thermodesulfobacteriota bacterium]